MTHVPVRERRSRIAFSSDKDADQPQTTSASGAATVRNALPGLPAVSILRIVLIATVAFRTYTQQAAKRGQTLKTALILRHEEWLSFAVAFLEASFPVC